MRFGLLSASGFLFVMGCGSNPYGMGGSAKKPLVTGASIDRLVFSQGVGVEVIGGGVTPEYRNAPIVSGKNAVVRVFLNVDESWNPREVVGVFGLKGAGDKKAEGFEATAIINGDSSDVDYNSTLNFDIPAEFITTDTSFSISVHETSRGGNFSGSDANSAFPSDGFTSLGVQRAGDIEVVIIPFSYDADGSGRLPDTTQPTLDRIQQRMAGMYPASTVTLTLAPVQAWSRPISPDGQGWGELLNEISNQRSTADVPANTYYYGYFAPTDSVARYCGQGCVLGLSLLGDVENTFGRASMGLGIVGEDATETANTITHEVGHAHGRTHAPCGLLGQASDPDYPYVDASIGVWGHELETGEQKNPAAVSDVMSYCSPVWVSDYTYRALFDRIQALQSMASYRPPDGFSPHWRSVVVGIDGQFIEGGTVTLQRPPGGERRLVEVRDGAGQVLGLEEGYFYPYSHIDGGLLVLPESTPAGALRFQAGPTL